MYKQIDRIKKTRLFLIDIIKDLSTDELNDVPEGFNNNIVWNFGHLIAAQQGLCYIRAGVTPVVDQKYIAQFKSGTKPEEYISALDIETLKSLSISSLAEFETDYANNKFANYNAWTTRYGVELTNIDDAIQFLTYHEGLHSGYIMALKRLTK